MPMTGLQGVTERFVVTFFVVSIILISHQVVTGAVWVVLDATSLFAWLSVIVPFTAAGASIVSTYAFVSYNQTNELRNLVLSMMSVSTTLISILYLTTHTGFPFPTVLQSAVYKTNLLAMTCGLVISAGFVAYTWLENRIDTRMTKVSVVAAFFVLPTTIASVISAYPSPDTPLSWQTIGLLGAGVVTVILCGSFYSISMQLRRWSRRTNSVPTAVILCVFVFLVSGCLSWYSFNQFVEVVAIFSISIGYSLLALSMMTVSVTEPHRGLTQIVLDRTAQLEQAKNESEFYLNIWSHEVGNVLQGIVLFVEQVAMKDVSATELPALAETARALTERATETIRQVSELARIKERDAVLFPVDLRKVVSESIQDLSVRFLNHPNSIQISRLEGDLFVRADSLLGHLIAYMIRNVISRSDGDGCHIRIFVYEKADLACIEIRDDARPLPEGAVGFLNGDARPIHTEIGLDLFLVRNLVNRYRGRVNTERLENVGENLTAFLFSQVQP